MPDQHSGPHDFLTVIGKRRNNTANTLHHNSPTLTTQGASYS
jgi:hypothetical protein